jgi:UDP-N-acetylglucosamine diphosphorylase/glucosamine-1-phosphate N-acetyltransferase
MIVGLVLFEDAHWRQLRPLTDVLPVPALAFGGSTLGERWRVATGAPLLGVAARAEVLGAWHEPPAPGAAPGTEAEVLVANAAALPEAWLAEVLDARGAGAWLRDERIVAARLAWGALAPLLESQDNFAGRLAALRLPARAVDARLIGYPWHLIEWNAEALALDLAGPGGIAGDVHPSAVLLAPERIRIAPGARVDPLVALDARGGPIAIGPGAIVQSHTHVIGPCAVGARSQLLGGVIAGSTIGPECRIAGEVEACVWQGYSNKRHHGFVGHSVIGEWVNLGALTTTSDLKNNYGPVRVWVDGAEVDSGNPKVGSLIGAHAKTGIGTLLPTGASVGVGANLFGGGRFAPKLVPAFAWWDGERTAVHELERPLATARTAMARRGRELTSADERLLRSLHPGAATRPGEPAARP